MADFAAFALAHLPPAPARVLEVGCGDEGGLVPALTEAGYDALGVDPRAPEGVRFLQATFQDAAAAGALGAYDAVVAGRMLHHVEPLSEALGVLASLAPLLVVDDFGWDAIDPVAQEWYERRYAELAAAGAAPAGPPSLDEWRERVSGLHRGGAVLEALRRRYRELLFEPRPFLYRWLDPASEAGEQALVDAGAIAAIGFRWVGTAG
jgi:hypothetical protein